MYYRKEKRKSLGARLFDILLLAAIILAGLHYLQSEEDEDAAAAAQAARNSIVAQNEATVANLKTLLKQSIQRHSKISDQLDSIHNGPYWTWKRMDFYEPIIFKQELEYTLYPCSQTWQDSVVHAKAQQALCFLLPQKQEEFVSLFQDAPMWLNQETRDKLVIAKNKMHLWVDIEKRTLALLEK